MQTARPKSSTFRNGEEHIRYVVPSEADCRAYRKLTDKQWSGVADSREGSMGHMPDDVTREYARRMHYAGYRASRGKNETERSLWRGRYFAMRDRVVLGNRKLVYGAVRKRMPDMTVPDDVIGDCFIVMIKAVAAYNPWIGVRFSTYAYTCLIRAMARMARRWKSGSVLNRISLEQLIDGPAVPFEEPKPESEFGPRIAELLNERHPLLTPREKAVIRGRFQFGVSNERDTLEEVGADLGLSKERVRQLQVSALEKMRGAFFEVEPTAS